MRRLVYFFAKSYSDRDIHELAVWMSEQDVPILVLVRYEGTERMIDLKHDPSVQSPLQSSQSPSPQSLAPLASKLAQLGG